MELLKKLAYMGIGAALILLVVLGVARTSAQEGEGQESAPAETPEEGAAVGGNRPGRAPRRGQIRAEPGAFLAEALGITPEALAEARETVRLAGVDAALAQGLITEAQAEWLRARDGHLPGRLPFPVGEFEFDADAALADALNITVAEVDAARQEARALALAARVEAGQITEEEAALIAARQAVQAYFDREALVEVMQEMYADAVQRALDAGEISAEQATLLLENPPRFQQLEQGGPRPGGSHGNRHPGFRRGPGSQNGPAQFAPQQAAPGLGT